jgi:hypothetical protein
VNIVAVAQTWELLVSIKRGPIALAKFTIERIENGRAYGHLERGRPYVIAVRVLRNGSRSARLVDKNRKRDAPHKPAREYKWHLFGDAKPAQPRVVAPRGVSKPNANYAKALVMQREGKSNGEIAAHFNRSTGTISAWLSRAREAEQDAKNGSRL